MKQSAMATTQRFMKRLSKAPVCIVLLVLTAIGCAFRLSNSRLFDSIEHISTDGNLPDITVMFLRGMLLLALPSSLWVGIITLLGLALAAPALEIKLGSRKFLLATLLCHIGAVIVLDAWTLGVMHLFPHWSRTVWDGWSGGVLATLFGVLLAASGNFNHLWRTRARYSALIIFATLMLYQASTFSVLGTGAVVVGLLLGLRWQKSDVKGLHPVFRERRLLVSLVIVCTSLGPLVASLSAHPAGPLEDIVGNLAGTNDPRGIRAVCRLAGNHACELARSHQGAGLTILILSIVPVILLLALCPGIVRGRWSAWCGALVLQLFVISITVVATILRVRHDLVAHSFGSDIRIIAREISETASILVPLAVIALLVHTKSFFKVHLPKNIIARQLRRYIALLIISLIIYIGGGLIMAHQWKPHANIFSLLYSFVANVIGLQVFFSMPPELQPLSSGAHILSYITGPTAWIIVICFVWRDMRTEHVAPSADRKLLHGIIERFGGGLFGWMTQWPGNQYWFDEGKNSAVAYRKTRGVALVLGEPISADPAQAAQDFATYCDREGQLSCFYSVGADFAKVAREQGWYALQVAEESRIALGEVAFKGKKFQDLRTAMNRADREGIHVEWGAFGDFSAARKRDIASVVEGWQHGKALPPLGFTLGGLKQMDDPQVRCEMAVDDDGRVHAVTSWLPIYKDGKITGWLLDVMRRREDDGGNVFHAGMELLIAKAILQFQEEGYEFVSLSASPLAMVHRETPVVDDPVSDVVYQRITDVAQMLEKYYSFSTLQRFKAKFKPEFYPLYLVYQDPGDLPVIGQAVATAYLTTEPTLNFGKIIRRNIQRNTDAVRDKYLKKSQSVEIGSGEND